MSRNKIFFSIDLKKNNLCDLPGRPSWPGTPGNPLGPDSPFIPGNPSNPREPLGPENPGGTLIIIYRVLLIHIKSLIL